MYEFLQIGINLIFHPSVHSLPPLIVKSSLDRKNMESSSKHTMTTSARGFIEWVCRGYRHKASALFDLLDNCDDATVKASEKRSSKWIHVKDKMRSCSHPVFVVTNGADDVKPISTCLEFARSDKKDTDQIGENGVGLKQSVVYLSDSGLVVTRQANGVISLALVSKCLNLSDDVPEGSQPIFPRLSFKCKEVLPSVSKLNNYLDKTSKSLADWPLSRWSKYLSGIKIAESIHDALSDAQINAEARLRASLFSDKKNDKEIFSSDKVYPFFRVILICDGSSDDGDSDEYEDSDDDDIGFTIRDSTTMNRISSAKIDDWLVSDPTKTVAFVTEEYPARYMQSLFNVQLLGPNKFPIMPIQWHKKFVNFSKYELHVSDASFPLPFNVYIGFDPSIVAIKESNLHVFSRGRLMSSNKDFRKLLGLRNYEADYQQGLTVFVEDIHSQLTLDPTKEGFRDCLELWKGLEGVVYSYYKLSIRMVLGPAAKKKRHNLQLQEAILKVAPQLEELDDLQIPFNDLDIHKLPQLKQQGSNSAFNRTIRFFEERGMKWGKHAVRFDRPAASGRLKPGYALEVYPAINPRAIENAENSSGRARKAPSRYDEPDSDDEYAPGKRAAKSQGKKTKSLTDDTKLNRAKSELLSLYQDHDGGSSEEPSFNADFAAQYSAWAKKVRNATTPKQIVASVKELETGILDTYKCRRWISDAERINKCRCSRCTTSREDWLEKCKATKLSTDDVLQIIAEFDHFATDGFKVANDDGSIVEYEEGLPADVTRAAPDLEDVKILQEKLQIETAKRKQCESHVQNALKRLQAEMSRRSKAEMDVNTAKAQFQDQVKFERDARVRAEEQLRRVVESMASKTGGVNVDMPSDLKRKSNLDVEEENLNPAKKMSRQNEVVEKDGVKTLEM